jgi:hypothetical protein
MKAEGTARERSFDECDHFLALDEAAHRHPRYHLGLAALQDEVVVPKLPLQVAGLFATQVGHAHKQALHFMPA